MNLSYQQLVQSFQESEYSKIKGKIEKFKGLQNKDAYNPCLIIKGEDRILAARVESRESNWLNPITYDPKILFFKNSGDYWEKMDYSPIFNLSEDPFAKWVELDGERTLIFGFVSTFHLANEYAIGTHLLKETDPLALDHGKDCFAEILHMKDVRLIQLPDKRFVVCPRPLGGVYRRGMVSFMIIDDLSNLTTRAAWEAKILDHKLNKDVWIGSNELYYLENGKIGTLGHVATMDSDMKRHYAAAVWEIDCKKSTTTEPRIILTRDNFPPGEGKERLLNDIIFPGSFEKLGNGNLRIYAGLGDTGIGSIEISNPFSAGIVY